jgi:hypothetical protein
MDQSTPKGSTPPAVDGMQPWAAPVLKRLDVGLTSSANSSTTKPLDGAGAGDPHQHS